MAKEKPTITGKVKRLWAAVNHSPDQVQTLLESLSKDNFNGKLKTQVIWVDQIRNSQFDHKAHIWIVVSAFALDLLCQKKIDMSKATVILVENCAVATQYKGIALLDATQVKSYQFKFKPLDSQMILDLRGSIEEELVDVARTKVDIIPALLNAQPPSALVPIMTFGYTVEASKRGRYIMDVFNIMRTGQSLTEVPWYNPSNKRMEALREWLESDLGRLVTQALIAALDKVKPTDGVAEIRQLAEEYQIDKFDINYSVEFMKRNSNVENPEMDTGMMYAMDENRQD